MMTLTSNAKAIAPNITTYFLASGGVAPYTYTIMSGGGSVNPSSGLYSADDSVGVVVVRALDSSLIPQSADCSISILSPLELLCDIIQTEMGLADGQVSLWDQKIDLPKTPGLFISVGVIACKAFSNSNKFDGVNNVQSTNFNATISIDIFSRNTEAQERKEEIVMALNSVYAQKQQEANSFYIAKVPANFVNVSYEESVSMLYRFNISVNMQYAKKKSSVPEYYDTFQGFNILTDN